MIRYAVQGFRAGSVLRAFRRTRKRVKVITAQTLNRQTRQARTRLTRAVQSRTGIKPQKRIRRRILIPRTGRATPRKLEAVYLALLEVTPLRWYGKGGPSVGRVEALPDTGRNSTGGVRRVVNLAQIVYPARARIQSWLAMQFPREMNRRLKVDLRKIWGRTAARAAHAA